MDKIKQTKRQLNISHWSKIISNCQASGLTVSTWCMENAIDKRRYYYWLRKIREETCKNLPTPSKVEIIPVASIPSSSMSTDIAANIKLGNISIEMMNNASTDVIKNLLGAINTLC